MNPIEVSVMCEKKSTRKSDKSKSVDNGENSETKMEVRKMTILVENLSGLNRYIEKFDGQENDLIRFVKTEIDESGMRLDARAKWCIENMELRDVYDNSFKSCFSMRRWDVKEMKVVKVVRKGEDTTEFEEYEDNLLSIPTEDEPQIYAALFALSVKAMWLQNKKGFVRISQREEVALIEKLSTIKGNVHYKRENEIKAMVAVVDGLMRQTETDYNPYDAFLIVHVMLKNPGVDFTKLFKQGLKGVTSEATYASFEKFDTYKVESSILIKSDVMTNMRMERGVTGFTSDEGVLMYLTLKGTVTEQAFLPVMSNKIKNTE